VPGLRLAGIRKQAARHVLAQMGRDVHRQLVDGAIAEQEVVERVTERLAGLAQQQVQPRRLDVGIDDPDPLAGHRQQRSDVRGDARLAVTATKGVHGNQFGGAALDHRGIQILESRRAVPLASAVSLLVSSSSSRSASTCWCRRSSAPCAR